MLVQVGAIFAMASTNQFQLLSEFAPYIENTSWKVLAYGIYARVVDVSEIEQVSAANE